MRCVSCFTPKSRVVTNCVGFAYGLEGSRLESLRLDPSQEIEENEENGRCKGNFSIY